ncbi:MAG TPA: hypothetical protein VEN81_07690 [Planctomycetota bacterium]|nr:hypothetical protein [Planctomycetota bacterium]
MKLVMSLALAAALVPQEAKGKGGVQVWDTGKSSSTPLTLESQSGWSEAKEGAALKGDGVVSNGRITAVFRRESGAIELGRVQLRLTGATKLLHATVTEVAKAGAAVEATYKTDRGEATAKVRLKKGDVSVEISPGAGATRLRVECPTRHVVLPDFFSDDMVIDAGKIPPAQAELPSENFLLHLAGKGEAIAMCVFQNREQDVKVTLSGEGERRVFTASEIEFGKDPEKQKIWVALLEAPQVWHLAEVKPGDSKKETKLDWKMPYPAQWRADFTRADDLTDSWDLLLQKEEGGEYLKPSWMGQGAERIPATRKRWTTVLGSFRYPVWSDPQGVAYVQPMDSKALELRGPLVLYPANRVPETPLDVFTVLDVARNSLGAGPCQYILDLDNQRSVNKGHATCWTRDFLTPIYQKGEQRSKQKEIDSNLDEVLTFVKYIRSRITRYYEFLHQMHGYLDAQAKSHPELKAPIQSLVQITEEADRRFGAREEKMKTPDYVSKMNDEFRKNVMDYEGADALDRCKNYTRALVEVGDNQDELSGELRWVVRALRQKAGLVLAQDPKMAPIVAEIRAKTQDILRSPAGHEGARH